MKEDGVTINDQVDIEAFKEASEVSTVLMKDGLMIWLRNARRLLQRLGVSK